MKPLVVMASPQRAIVDYLTAAFAGRAEPYLAGVQVGMWYPSASSPEAPSIPYLQVNSDGVPSVSYPVTARATIRCTAWHNNPGPSEDLAWLTLGLLAVHPGDDRVWAVRVNTGPIPAPDPGSRHYLTYVTVGVSVRPAAA